jgi:hypothetical protein
VESDKAKNDATDLDVSFDDVDLGWSMKASSKALQNIAAGKQLPSGSLGTPITSNAASATGTGSPRKPFQASSKQSPALAIEDAKERDKLLGKVEEALKGSYGLALRLSKAIAQLPATVLGSKHRGSLEEIDTVVKEQESLLKHIAITGTFPGKAGPLV